MRERRQAASKNTMSCKAEAEIFSYTNSYHQNTVMDSMKELYESQNLCDVTLVAEEQEVKAHRAVLASCSPYFFTMFTGKLKEARQEVVQMQNITYLALCKIVTYCYTCSVEIAEENLFELLTAADMLQFTAIKESTCAFLSNKLTPANCIELSIFADMHSCHMLKDFSNKFAKENFRAVIRTDAFLETGYDQVQELLSSDSLGINSEKDVFEAAVSWVKHDKEARLKWLPSLINLVRLYQLPPKVLVDCVENEAVVAENTECMRLINDAKTYHLIPDWNTATTDERIDKMLEMRSIIKESKIYVIGGEVHQKVYNSMEVYSYSQDKWSALQPMHVARDGVGVSTYDGKIYAAGGCDGKTALKCLEVYTPETDSWKYYSSMNEARHAFSMTEHSGWLYAFGGSDFTTTEYSSVERYDPIRDNWSFLPHMNAKREGLVSVSLDGALYSIGGDNGVSILNTVERFDPRTGKWYYSTSMGYRRRYCGGTVLNGKIYIAGGSDYDEDLNSVECFDPRANRWQFLPSMNNRRESVAVTAVGGKLLAIGGACVNRETNTVEAYDPLLNKWDMFAAMIHAKEGMGVVVL
eukprot:gene4620-5227_t